VSNNRIRQLTRSIGIVEENNRLREKVADLERQLAKARLLCDMRRDLAAFELSADSLPALLRPQA